MDMLQLILSHKHHMDQHRGMRMVLMDIQDMVLIIILVLMDIQDITILQCMDMVLMDMYTLGMHMDHLTFQMEVVYL